MPKMKKKTTKSKISKATRDQAAEYLSKLATLYANNDDAWGGEIDLKVEPPAKVLLLAEHAFYATPLDYQNGNEIPTYLQYAEAESWVLSGWEEPGDEKEFE